MNIKKKGINSLCFAGKWKHSPRRFGIQNIEDSSKKKGSENQTQPFLRVFKCSQIVEYQL